MGVHASLHSSSDNCPFLACIETDLQVWWTLAAGRNSRLYTHDLGTAITTELPDVGTDATILSLSADGAGRVWMGHQNGLVQAWCANFQSPICQLTKMSAADVRYLSTGSKEMGTAIQQRLRSSTSCSNCSSESH